MTYRAIILLLAITWLAALSCSHQERALEEVPRHKVDKTDPDPKPFSPTTTIQYSTRDTCHVTVVLYNVAGQMIDTLVNEVQPPGEHQFQFQSEKLTTLPTGVYFYKLESCGETTTKKMVMMK